ncbi:sensor histidine kinase [uncultured Paracoccus sp.]|uniref:sensor histidine kinase n=1 Tax=uncultured Paracoccus sp. TaxID=189685 RepID=UPI0026385EA9|nr:sensor histidine kinase [uncultured Paracoccus sp.]
MTQPANPSRPFALGVEAVLMISVIICASMLVLGATLNAYIRDVEIKAVSASHAVFMSLLMEPLLTDLPQNGPLPDAVKARLDEVLAAYITAKEIGTALIWWPDGTIAYSTDPRLVGLQTNSEHLAEALAGGTVAILEHEPAVHGLIPERRADETVLELYVPLKVQGVPGIAAVGEFYQDPTRLLAQMRVVSVRIWAGIGLTTFLMMGLLLLLAGRARRIVQMQQAELNRRLIDSQDLARQNDRLRRIAEQAKLDAVEVNEDLLNRIGADLHDGPLQLLGLAILHSDEVASEPGPGTRMSAVSLTSQAIRELRHLADGLSVPELAGLSVPEVLRLAVARHERQTGSSVLIDLGALPEDLPEPVKISLYRVVQEGLTNAFRHAGGEGQEVRGRLQDDAVEITVSDHGPGIAASAATGPMTGLGLAGIARRVQTLGGKLEVASHGGRGTRVTVRLPV